MTAARSAVTDTIPGLVEPIDLPEAANALESRLDRLSRELSESTATIKLVNLVMKRDSVFMAFSSGVGPQQTPFWCGNALLVNPLAHPGFQAVT